MRVLDLELRKEIQEAMELDEVVKKALTAIKQNRPLPLKSSTKDWEVLEGNTILFKGKCYVPLDTQLWRKIV